MKRMTKATQQSLPYAAMRGLKCDDGLVMWKNLRSNDPRAIARSKKNLTTAQKEVEETHPHITKVRNASR
jgi:hypothetical protein